jgi:hypothetical protein
VRWRFRNQLNDTVTAILLACETALQVANLPAVEAKVRSGRELAQPVGVRLDGA